MDNAGTSPLSDITKRTILECLGDDSMWANPSSIYGLGRAAKKHLEDARAIVAECLGCRSVEIYFTSGSSESINWVLKGCMDSPNATSDRFMVSSMEHPCVYAVSDYLRSTGNFVYSCVKATVDGTVDIEDYKRLFDENDYNLISCIMVQNEIGTLNPIKELCEIAHDRGAVFFTDVTAAVGKVPVDLKSMNVDYACGSARKWGGVGGTGFCYISEDSRIKSVPLIHGSQERRQRGGTENVFGAWVAACTLRHSCNNVAINAIHIDNLKKLLIRKLNESGIKYQLNGNPLDENNSGVGIVNICLPNMKMDAESLLLLLGVNLPNFEKPVYVSAGSACSSGSSSPSRVLMELPGMDRERAGRSIRVSLSHTNTEEEILYFCEKLCFVLQMNS